MDAARRYINHFSLIAEPFGDLSDRRFLWLSEKHLENIALLKVGVEEGKGVLLLVGEEGSGKSVMMDCLMKVLPGDLKVAVVREPGIDVARFFAILSEKFGLESEKTTKGVFLFRFKEFLKKMHAAGNRVLLILESGGSQTDEVIEQIRLLSNMEEEGDKLLGVLLVGDGRLGETLSKPQHRAMLQRIATKCRVEALTEAETDAYIRHRMMVAGAFLRVFLPDSVKLIHRLSGGLPRLINLFCAHALMHACREGLRRIDAKVVQRYADDVLKSLGLGGGSGTPPLQPPASAKGVKRSKKSGPMLKLVVSFVALFCLLLFAGFVQEVFKSKVHLNGADPNGASISFDIGSISLKAETSIQLDRLSEFMARDPGASVTIKGFADKKTPPNQAFSLSRARADAVKSYLVGKGVGPARIATLGLGAGHTNAERPDFEHADSNSKARIEFCASNSR